MEQQHAARCSSSRASIRHQASPPELLSAVTPPTNTHLPSPPSSLHPAADREAAMSEAPQPGFTSRGLKLLRSSQRVQIRYRGTHNTKETPASSSQALRGAGRPSARFPSSPQPSGLRVTWPNREVGLAPELLLKAWPGSRLVETQLPTGSRDLQPR